MGKKIFFTYDEQIDLLKNKKQLIIEDPKFAKNTLKKLGYFSLIGGYKDLFKHRPSGNYIRGVTFEEITAFYYFDEELRTLFFKYILHVERHLKAMLSYSFCEKYGDSQNAYLNVCNFNYSKRNQSDVLRLVQSLKKATTLPSNYAYITHYAVAYKNVPLWVTTNTLTFGQISKLYQYTTSDIRSKISIQYANISEAQLHKFIRILARCRNVCAHNERLYSFISNEAIPDMPLHKKLSIKKIKGQFTAGKRDLFAVVIALRYLIGNEEFKQFKTKLTLLINKSIKDCPHLNKSTLLAKMGFPENWDKIAYYKK